MYLEVLIGSEEPVTYPFNKKKLTLGSAESNDIVITASGVSRKHVQFLTEGDNYFVIDQGSTNGTFLNEERLVPGRRVEFNSFFPVRLGDKVLITLLSETHDSMNPELMSISLDKELKKESDSTTRINLKNLKDPALTQKLVLETQTKRAKKKKASPVAVKKKNISIGFVPLLAFLIIAGAAYYNFFLKEEAKPEIISKVGEVIEVKPEPIREPAPQTLEPTSTETITNLMRDLKCTTDIEKYLCEKFSIDPTSRWGAVQAGTRLNLMLDGAAYLQEGNVNIQESTSSEDRKLIVAAIFISKGIPDDLDLTALGDVSLNFTLFQGEEVFFSFALSPKVLRELKSSLPQDYGNLEALSVIKQFVKLN
jgi:pSer/pThr/pTyr-binding forkhead associated (FHA) protein